MDKNKKEEVKLEFEVIYPTGFDKATLFSHLSEMPGIITFSE